jgi:hypothetical protein
MVGGVKRKTVMNEFFNKGELLPDNRSDFKEIIRKVSDDNPDSDNLVFEYGLKKLADKYYGKKGKNEQ